MIQGIRIMSTVTGFRCGVCSNIVAAQDKTPHAATHKGTPAVPRADFGGKLMDDEMYALQTFKNVITGGNSGGVKKKVGLPSVTAIQAFGVTERTLEAATSGMKGAGATLSESGAIMLFEHLQKQVFHFDNSSFLLSFAAWMIATQGSMKEGDAGKLNLKPHRSKGVLAASQDVSMAEIFLAMDNFGKTIGITVTPRKLFEVPSIFQQSIWLYINHPAFDSIRRTGTIKSNAAGFPTAEFYKVLPSYDRMTTSFGASQLELNLLKNARRLGVVDAAQVVPEIKDFDPLMQNPHVIQTIDPLLSPSQQLATNVAAAGLVQSLTQRGSGP